MVLLETIKLIDKPGRLERRIPKACTGGTLRPIGPLINLIYNIFQWVRPFGPASEKEGRCNFEHVVINIIKSIMPKIS